MLFSYSLSLPLCVTAYSAPIRLVDFPIGIVRPQPDSRCQGLPILGMACMTLLGIPDHGLPFTDSRACSGATALAVTSRCDRMLHDQGRGPQYRAIEEDGQSILMSLMLGFINNTVSEDWLSSVREAGRNFLPVMHSLTLQADQSVLKENTDAGWSVPRSVLVVYHQHEEETLLARKAITCLFLDYLYHSDAVDISDSELFASTLPSELSDCFSEDNGVAVAEWAQRWGAASWTNVADFSIN